MALQDIVQNPLTPAFLEELLYLMLSRSCQFGSAWPYPSVFNIASIFVFFVNLIALVEVKSIIERYLTSPFPEVRYLVLCGVFLLLQVISKLLEFFTEYHCHCIETSYKFIFSAHPWLQILLGELLTTCLGIFLFIIALMRTATGHRVLGKIKALLTENLD